MTKVLWAVGYVGIWAIAILTPLAILKDPSFAEEALGKVCLVMTFLKIVALAFQARTLEALKKDLKG